GDDYWDSGPGRRSKIGSAGLGVASMREEIGGSGRSGKARGDMRGGFVLGVQTRALPTSCIFFLAEGGIRDRNVTGVQTCALPIWTGPRIGRVAAIAAGGVPAVEVAAAVGLDQAEELPLHVVLRAPERERALVDVPHEEALAR